MITYDQTHYMWAREQLTDASGWGIHASSNMDPGFLAVAESFSKGYKPNHDRYPGETLLFDQRRNCFLRMGVSYCESKENNRTNHICHLLIPAEPGMQIPGNLFIPFAFDTEETAEKQLSRITMEKEPEDDRYYEILEKYGFLQNEKWQNKLGRLLYDFWRIVRKNQQNISICLGSYAADKNYRQVVMDIMWLLHTLAGDDIRLRRKLTFNLYVDGPAAGICFTDQNHENALVLDQDFTGSISSEMPVEMMFLHLAECAVTSPGRFRREFNTLISIGQKAKTSDLELICCQWYLEHGTDKEQEEIFAYVRSRSIAKTWGAVPYQKLYLTGEAKKAGRLTARQADEDWKIISYSMDSKTLMEEYPDFIYNLITVFKKGNHYKYVSKMIPWIRGKSEKCYMSIMGIDCKEAVSERLIFWHTKAMSSLDVSQKLPYLKVVLQLYSPVVRQNLQEQEFVGMLVEKLGEMYPDPAFGRETLSSFVIGELVPLCGDDKKLDQSWHQFIEKEIRNKLETDENGLAFYIVNMENLDAYAAYPICMAALQSMKTSLEKYQEPEGNLSRLRIQEWFIRSGTTDPDRIRSYQELFRTVITAEESKEFHDKMEVINSLTTLERVLDHYDMGEELNISRNWCQKLLFCIDNHRIVDSRLEAVKACIRRCIKIHHDFQIRSDGDWKDCIIDMENAVRKIVCWLLPDSELAAGSRIEKINACRWCMSVLDDIGDEKVSFSNEVLNSIRESDFISLLEQVDFCDWKQVHDFFNIRIVYEAISEQGEHHLFYTGLNRDKRIRGWLLKEADLETDFDIRNKLKLMEKRFRACELVEMLEDEGTELSVSFLKEKTPDLVTAAELIQNQDDAVAVYLRDQFKKLEKDIENERGCYKKIMGKKNNEELQENLKKIQIQKKKSEDKIFALDSQYKKQLFDINTLEAQIQNYMTQIADLEKQKDNLMQQKNRQQNAANETLYARKMEEKKYLQLEKSQETYQKKMEENTKWLRVFMNSFKDTISSVADGKPELIESISKRKENEKPDSVLSSDNWDRISGSDVSFTGYKSIDREDKTIEIKETDSGSVQDRIVHADKGKEQTGTEVSQKEQGPELTKENYTW